MNSVRLPVLVLLTLILLFLHGMPSATADPSPGVVDPSKRTIDDLVEKCELIGSFDAEQIAKGIAEDDDTISLLTGWERFRRTLPVDSEIELVPEPTDVTRMLGLIEGRLHTPIPQWWQSAFVSMKSHGRYGFSFTVPALAPDSPPADALTVGFQDGTWRLVRHGRSLADLGRPGVSVEHSHVEILESGEASVIAISSWPPDPYSIWRVSTASGALLWKSTVYAGGGFGSYQMARGPHIARLYQDGDRVIVFGASLFVIYVETFDVRTGDSLCRFCNSYFRRRQ